MNWLVDTCFEFLVLIVFKIMIEKASPSMNKKKFCKLKKYP